MEIGEYMKNNKDSQINYEKRPMPSSPGPQQITVNGQESKKGGSDFVSKMPKENLIPGDKSAKPFSSR